VLNDYAVAGEAPRPQKGDQVTIVGLVRTWDGGGQLPREMTLEEETRQKLAAGAIYVEATTFEKAAVP
jgi:hypothetical protein